MVKVQQTYADKFNKGKLKYTSDPYNKTAEEFLERCMYYYGMYSSNQCFLGYGGSYRGREFKTLRDHARGLQNVDKYKDWIDPKKNKGEAQGKRKLNISWRPSMFLAKFKDIVKDKFRTVNVEPQTQAVDELARVEKAEKYNKLKFLSKEETSSWLQSTGVQFQEPDLQGLESEADVDLYARMGGIRLGVEIMLKDALDVSRSDSDFDLIKNMIIDDAIDLNAMAVHVIKNPNTGRLEYEYVDVARVGMRHSVYPDGRDCDFKFFIKTVNISSLRNFHEVDEEEIRKIEKNYSGQYGNPSSMDYLRSSGLRRDYASKGVSDRWTHDDYKVDVMTLYFIDKQVKRFVTGRRPSGSMIYDEVGPDAKLRGRDKKTKSIEEVHVHNVYKCHWIVGTDYVFDYGIDQTIVREGANGVKKPIIPLITYVGQEPSIIQRCIGF